MLSLDAHFTVFFDQLISCSFQSLYLVTPGTSTFPLLASVLHRDFAHDRRQAKHSGHQSMETKEFSSP